MWTLWDSEPLSKFDLLENHPTILSFTGTVHSSYNQLTHPVCLPTDVLWCACRDPSVESLAPTNCDPRSSQPSLQDVSPACRPSTDVWVWSTRMGLKHKDGHVVCWAGQLGLISILRPLFNMRACLSSLLLGLFALQRSLGSTPTAGLGLNTHSPNRTRLPVSPVLNAHAHNRTRLSVGPVLSSRSHNRTRLSVGSVLNPYTQNRTKLPDGGKDPHHRPKRGWVWNQFYVLEEHIGPEPQYVGKVRATTFSNV